MLKLRSFCMEVKFVNRLLWFWLIISAAAEGVGALKSETKSEIVKSVS